MNGNEIIPPEYFIESVSSKNEFVKIMFTEPVMSTSDLAIDDIRVDIDGPETSYQFSSSL